MHGKAVHDLANILGAVTAAVGYLVERSGPLPEDIRDAICDLELCTERLPGLLARLRGPV